MQSPVKFSSCRGVSFEIKAHADPFAIKNIPTEEVSHGSSKSWRLKFSKELLSLDCRSIGNSSSHFCDLELDVDKELEDHDDDLDEEDKIVLNDLEGQNMQKPVQLHDLFATSKREGQPKANAHKQGSRLSVILLDQRLSTVYKRLFVVCLALNITALILAATGNFSNGKDRAALFSIANILALTLCRSEAFLRVVFWLAVKIFGHSWVPLFLKTATTSLLQSLGGIHISSIAWLAYALVLTLKGRENTSPEIIGIASAILGLLCLSSLAVFPLVRHLHHNIFERTDRFAGWTALGLLWAFIVLMISYNPKTKSYDTKTVCATLMKRQEFWFTVTITTLIIIPLLTTRRVTVQTYALSGHAFIIKREERPHDARRSRRDFTKPLVSNPPNHLWVRRAHFAGLPYLVNMYDRVLLVATGSGICVFLSFLLQPSPVDVRVIWVAKGIEQNLWERDQTYGKWVS
ncbi:Transmembrane protein [Trema orientale]|uniref:Transmembrane protein n=1 Tax=Trema orientale TaxID=63057 RepID=A0A2P5FMT8_TREOI|nr:Transmembrane protein [Trema orientale]